MRAQRRRKFRVGTVVLQPPTSLRFSGPLCMVAYTMSKLCDVVDCLNTRRGLPTTATSADPRPVFYHALPLDEPRRTQWLNAVHFRKVKGRELRAPKVCSLHFAPSDYDVDHDPTLSQALGFSYMRPKLSATAVPSMTLRHQEQQGTSQDRSSVVSPFNFIIIKRNLISA